MKDINISTISGSLGKDAMPFDGGIKFSIASNLSYLKDGEWKTITDWYNVTFFGKIPFELLKGDRVLVQGKFKTREYQGKYYTELVADIVEKIQRTSKAKEQEDIGGYEPEPNDSQSDVPF